MESLECGSCSRNCVIANKERGVIVYGIKTRYQCDCAVTTMLLLKGPFCYNPIEMQK